MRVATAVPAAPRETAPPASQTAGVVPASAGTSLIRLTGGAALLAFAGLLALALLAPAAAGRLFWTVAVASLPLVFVLAGYHTWRRICPLAWIAQLPARAGVAGRRRAGPWLQAHGYHVAFGLFVVSLWLRLVATNGDGYALAAFVGALSLAALGVGLVFTGKTWCNFVCPVSFVERLYTEPRGLAETPNSQCATCTACKPTCPDINEENSYWKEITSPAKRHVYYAFPGVVIAFYVYYYLQSGTWAYYFDGTWTNQPGLHRTAFLPGAEALTAGFFFWPRAPRALAAALTLGAGGMLSALALSALERPVGAVLRRRAEDVDASTVRHLMFTAAACAAFVSFYTFAGAPTLRLVPGLPHAFQILVVATATLLLVRRLRRRQTDFTEETLARRIIANWQWKDTPAPKNLREAFLIHTVRSKSHEEGRRRLIALYKQSVRDSLQSGMLSRLEVHRLGSLRSQLGVSDADHERVMAELAQEDDGMAATAAWSPEKHLQLETYTEALARHLERLRDRDPLADDLLVRDLRAQFEVTPEEHAAVLDRLLRRQDGVAAHLTAAPGAIERLAAAVAQLAEMRAPAARFAVRLLGRAWMRTAETLAQAIGAGEDAETEPALAGLLSPDAEMRAAAVDAVGAKLSPAMAQRLAASAAREREQIGAAPSLDPLLRAHLGSPDPYVRAVAIYLLLSRDAATDEDVTLLIDDEHPVVRETASRRPGGTLLGGTVTATTLEKMIGLSPIGIFDDLEPEDLAELARAGTERWFVQNQALCHAGERGDEAFVILDGEVSVLGPDGRIAYTEGPGSCIGELAVLDPAPREATVVASTVAVRALGLTGGSLRKAIATSPAVSAGLIRMLARRLRRALPAASPVSAP